MGCGSLVPRLPGLYSMLAYILKMIKKPGEKAITSHVMHKIIKLMLISGAEVMIAYNYNNYGSLH